MKVKNKNAGMVQCLGWCNKSFFSRDRVNIRFCPKCAAKKNTEQLKLPRIKMMRVGDFGE